MEKIARVAGVVVAVAVFVVFTRLVDKVSETETMIGLAISAVAGLSVWWGLRPMSKS